MKSNVTKTLLSGMLIFASMATFACPVCEKQQPQITQGLTHGAGPASNWDWIIIGVVAAITLLTLVYSVKFLVRPGESNANHIKQSILSN